MAGEVGGPILVMGPPGILRDHLGAELTGNAKPFGHPELRDAGEPIPILLVADSVPLPVHELTNPARDHATILVSLT